MQRNVEFVVRFTAENKWLFTIKPIQELNLTCAHYVERGSLQKQI